MRSEPSLHGVRGKHARALMHLEQFKGEAEILLSAYRDVVVEVTERDGRLHFFELDGAPPAPDHWPALVGDILHNLRSTLDHLAWQLVLVGGRGTKEPTQRTAFPILDSPPVNDLPDIRPGVSDAIRQVLDSVQCYSHVPDLRILRILSNVDKHRELVPVVAFLRHAGWGVPEGIETRSVARNQPAEDGDRILTIECNPGFNEPLSPSFEFGIALDPDALVSALRIDRAVDASLIYRGDLVSWALGFMADFVGRVVDRFKPFFESTTPRR